jgi:predicted PurR-regulated permease PerM
VEITQPNPGALQTLGALITPLLQPLTTTGIVVIFVIFILIQRQDLRNRLVRLAGSQDLQRTTAAIDDAGQRLSRLFLTQLALNASFGLVIGTGLWIIGVPSAPFSATFWTWLWGPIGLVVATPLTICLVVLGRYVDRLSFLDVMFGDEPALTSAELVYQRMLARDPVEVSDQARKFLKEKPLIAYYEEVLLEGLRLAEADL